MNVRREENVTWSDLTTARNPDARKIRSPKLDLTYAFPIFKNRNALPLGFAEHDCGENFSGEFLKCLRNDGGVNKTIKSTVTTGLDKKNVRELNAYDVMCFPWAVVEVKHADVKPHEIRKCYCQAANASAVALGLQESLFVEAYGSIPGDLPPVVAFTCVGPDFKVWLTFRDQQSEERRVVGVSLWIPEASSNFLQQMISIWATSLELNWGVYSALSIVTNMHTWASRILKPRLSGCLSAIRASTSSMQADQTERQREAWAVVLRVDGVLDNRSDAETTRSQSTYVRRPISSPNFDFGAGPSGTPDVFRFGTGVSDVPSRSNLGAPSRSAPSRKQSTTVPRGMSNRFDKPAGRRNADDIPFASKRPSPDIYRQRTTNFTTSKNTPATVGDENTLPSIIVSEDPAQVDTEKQYTEHSATRARREQESEGHDNVVEAQSSSADIENTALLQVSPQDRDSDTAHFGDDVLQEWRYHVYELQEAPKLFNATDFESSSDEEDNDEDYDSEASDGFSGSEYNDDDACTAYSDSNYGYGYGSTFVESPDELSAVEWSSEGEFAEDGTVDSRDMDEGSDDGRSTDDGEWMPEEEGSGNCSSECWSDTDSLDSRPLPEGIDNGEDNTKVSGSPGPSQDLERLFASEELDQHDEARGESDSGINAVELPERSLTVKDVTNILEASITALDTTFLVSQRGFNSMLERKTDLDLDSIIMDYLLTREKENGSPSLARYCTRGNTNTPGTNQLNSICYDLNNALHFRGVYDRSITMKRRHRHREGLLIRRALSILHQHHRSYELRRIFTNIVRFMTMEECVEYIIRNNFECTEKELSEKGSRAYEVLMSESAELEELEMKLVGNH